MLTKSQVVLITGASSGLGKSTAQYLSEIGYLVFGASRNKPEGVGFNWVCMDVTSEDSIRMAIQNILSEAGRIDVLINNAGLGIVGPLEDTTDEQIYKVFNTNVMGVLRVCRAIIPHFRQQQKGMILNISSIAAAMGLPYRGIYCATKASLEIITESLSIELKAFNIRVCSILPGDIATDINQNRLVAEPRSSSVYSKTFARIHRQINKEVSQGPNPIVIARAVASVIEKSNPRLHYTIGPFLQRMAVWLHLILPQRFFERILMKFYGM